MVDGQQVSSDAASQAASDEQTLADGRQILGDSEQTLADSEEVLSDSDQTSADGDQSSADRDQLAADRDQAASDRDLAHGADPSAHERSHDIRQLTTRAREQSTRERTETAGSRLGAADQRDALAESRDVAAQRRDEESAARNVAMAELDVAFEEQEAGRASASAEDVVRATGQRQRAAQRRAQAAAYRDLAAADRRAAALDRQSAAEERRLARSDRRMLRAELRREQERSADAARHQLRAEKLARTLQRSLSPPRLPGLAGLDVAVHHEPCAPAEVGGDFYDLFPLAPDRAGFFLGDVCGKGPDAATVTALARYTMRTAALLHESPDAILHGLNSALHMETASSRQTCTVVYGQIETGGPTAAVILAVAGHPPPLVVRASGSVETTSARGTMLGAVERPSLQTCALSLMPGDAIVIYSHGILDSEIDGLRVDEKRIADHLSGFPGASAEDHIARLLRAVRRIDPPLRDDVALMAVRHMPAA